MQKIVRAVLHLHAMQLQHGDLHPNNILIEVGDVRFIDALDIPCSGENIIFTPAYVPTDYESLPMEERDCYAVAKVCNEILEHDVTGKGLIHQLYLMRSEVVWGGILKFILLTE
ncbi:hypothetical protein ACRB9V_22885 [Salmonella enterica subsp. enterica serovar Paratyphi A]